MINSRYYNNTMYMPYQTYLDWAEDVSPLIEISSWGITTAPGPVFILNVNGVAVGAFQSQPEALSILWGIWATWNTNYDPAAFEAAVAAPTAPLPEAGQMVFGDQTGAGEILIAKAQNWDLDLTHPITAGLPLARLVQENDTGGYDVLATGTWTDRATLDNLITYTLTASDVGKARYFEITAANVAPMRVGSTGYVPSEVTIDIPSPLDIANDTYSATVGGSWTGTATVTPLWGARQV